jgi:hypothetical protein
MTEIYPATNTSPDELDLLSIVAKTTAFLKKFGMLIIGGSLIGLVLGSVLYKLTPKLYPSSLILHSSIYTNQDQIQIIENWSDLLNKNEYAVLAKFFNCSPDLLSKVKDLSAEEIQKSIAQDNPNGFIVEVLVRDNSVLDSLQKGLVYGLENNSYIKERTLVKKANYQEMIKKVRDEIAKLDSTKSIVESIISNKTRSTSPIIMDVSSINTQLIALNEKQLSYEEELKFIDPIHVLQSFSKFSKPKYPKPITFLFVGLITGAFLGYVISLFLYVRGKLRSRRDTPVVS